MSTPESQSMLDALRSDHRTIAGQLESRAAAAQDHDGLAERAELVMAMVRHFVAEEQYLYPTVRESLVDGPARAEAGFQADRAIEKHLRSLEDKHLTATQLEQTWAQIGAEFAGHALDQETLFADLATACTPEQLAELGDGVAGAEQLAPTRPRSVAPESAGANRLFSIVEGYVDQVRDYYAKRGVESDEPQK